MRKFKLSLHRLLNTKKKNLDGICISTDKNKIPENVRFSLYKNEYEKHERSLVKKYLKRGTRVLEVGTGIGLVSLLVSKICGTKNVLSYEANPDMENIIRENYKLNNIEPNLVMRAITKDGGEIVFYKDDGILSSSIIDRGIKSTKCKIKSDSLIQVLIDHNPDFIVMDIEGAEIELLQNTDLSKITGIIIELHEKIVGKLKNDQLISRLQSQGFKIAEVSHKTYVFIK